MCYCDTIWQIRYLCLLMGVCNSPNFVQEIMEDIFQRHDPYIEIFDDIGIFGDNFDTTLESIKCILHHFIGKWIHHQPLEICSAGNRLAWLSVHTKWNKALQQAEINATPLACQKLVGPLHIHWSCPFLSWHVASLGSLPHTINLTHWQTGSTDTTHQRAFECMKVLIITDTCHLSRSQLTFSHIHRCLGLPIWSHHRTKPPYHSPSYKLTGPQHNWKYNNQKKNSCQFMQPLRKFTLLFGAENHIHTDHKISPTPISTHNVFYSLETLHWRILIPLHQRLGQHPCQLLILGLLSWKEGHFTSINIIFVRFNSAIFVILQSLKMTKIISLGKWIRNINLTFHNLFSCSYFSLLFYRQCNVYK